MSAHTPGPWFAQPDPDGRGDDYVIGIGDAAPIDYVATCWKRDAHLIAAAPDLLASANRVTAAFRALGRCQSAVDTLLRLECEASMLALDAAIAKAEGRT